MLFWYSTVTNNLRDKFSKCDNYNETEGVTCIKEMKISRKIRV